MVFVNKIIFKKKKLCNNINRLKRTKAKNNNLLGQDKIKHHFKPKITIKYC